MESYTGGWDRNLTGDGEPARVETSYVTAGLFEMLGVTPELGRTFLSAEEWAGQHEVVILPGLGHPAVRHLEGGSAFGKGSATAAAFQLTRRW